jgi:hypothetical protein
VRFIVVAAGLSPISKFWTSCTITFEGEVGLEGPATGGIGPLAASKGFTGTGKVKVGNEGFDPISQRLYLGQRDATRHV